MKHGFLTFLASHMHIFSIQGRNCLYYVSGHRKDTGRRYVVETLFHYSRQVRSYLYLTLFRLYMLGSWRFSAFASNRDVSSRSQLLK